MDEKKAELTDHVGVSWDRCKRGSWDRKRRKKGRDRLARKLEVQFTRSDDETKVVWKQLAG